MLERQGVWLEKGDKLVLLGDSLTAAANGYSRIVAEHAGKLGVTVVNAGVGGDKTPTALARLRSDVLSHSPTAVSIFLVTNYAAVGRGVWADEPRIPVEAYASNLEWIIQLCRQGGVKKFSITPPLLFEGRELADYGDVMRDYQLAARRVAEDRRAHFVPADTACADEWRRQPHHTGLLLTTDGTHLTPAANELLAKTMLMAWGLA